MSAILTLALALLKMGDRVAVSTGVFGSTVSLFTNILNRYGVESDFVQLTDFERWTTPVSATTRLLFIETPSNPLSEVGDIGALADLAHRNDCLLAVDNAYCTPALQRPPESGCRYCCSFRYQVSGWTRPLRRWCTGDPKQGH